jgi:hypothetical protein
MLSNLREKINLHLLKILKFKGPTVPPSQIPTKNEEMEFCSPNFVVEQTDCIFFRNLWSKNKTVCSESQKS